MADITQIKVGSTTYDIKDTSKLGKTTYEWNKEFAAGSNGAVSLGRYNIYDSQLTFDIDCTTTTAMSGKLIIATQNGKICEAKIFGNASKTLVSYLKIYQSAITNNRSWIEVFCNFPGWSKNKVHIYGIALNSSTVTNQMASVTFTNDVPSGVTSGDTLWTGTIGNDTSPVATTSVDGLMSAADKTKLNGIAANANAYSLPAATSSALGGVKTSTGITNSSGTISVTYGTAAGTACQGNDSRLSDSRTPKSHTHGNITNDGKITSTAVTAATGVLVYDSSNKIQRATAAQTRSIIGAGTSNLAIGTTSTTAAAGNHTHSVATTSANGLMSKDDKTLLNNIDAVFEFTDKNTFCFKAYDACQAINWYNGTISLWYDVTDPTSPMLGVNSDIVEVGNAALKLNKIQAPTASNGSTYSLGTSGQVLKSNGTSVYWASDNNTTYNSHTRGTTGSTSASMVIPAAAARQIHTWWRTSTDLYSLGSNTWAGSIQTVAAANLYSMQSWSPAGDTSARSSNYGTALNNSMNSSNFATNLNAMGTAAWVSPCKGDYVIDPYGCIGVIENIPLGTALQGGYPVRLVYKSNTKWNYTCVEEGTLITMSDGTYRPVEELDQGDLIMGWDFENNKPTEAVTLFAKQTQNLDKMTYMIFSNGEYISFSAEHELYSKTHQKYMFINDLKEGDIVMGKDGEDVEIMSIHRDIWSFGRKNFYQVVSSNNTYFANNILNAMHPINKLNWVQYGLMQEIPQEIMEIFVEDCREFDCWQFLVQDKAFLKQAVSIQREMKLRSNRIDELKQYLAKTDYVALKYSEGESVDTTIIEQRQASRLEINKLEDELNNQYQPEYNELLTSHALIGEDILLSDTERQIKYFRLACKRDNENLELFKKHYPVKERIEIDWENYVLPVVETEEELIEE